ncbi:hypothetical protein ACJIZ3_014358 [Penstemon smallii]|uniref:Uncharacterized protein n=1 Tax=Penstemon smallii TaxID=265156 RepID=A0ABD3RUG7_9LAMI
MAQYPSHTMDPSSCKALETNLHVNGWLKLTRLSHFFAISLLSVIL